MSRYPKPGTILCVCIALGTLLRCGVAQAGLWEHPGARDPMVGDGPFTGAHSEVPPGWSMSRTDPTGALGPARRDPSVSLDPAAGRIRESYVQGGVEMAPPMVSDLDSYSTLLTQRSYRKLWKDSSRETRSISRTGQKRTSGLLHYELPPMFKVPRQLRGLLGDGAPNIDVSGSETITLSGISDWTVRPQNSVVSEHKRPSAFPSLEMKQDLQVNLTGSIGDKIKVDVDQSSNVQTNLDNKVKLRYEGDEDDMIKSVDLGNTNLSLQGASIRQEGLFGVKTVAKLGNVDLVTIASKQEGKSETSRFTPSGEKRQVKVPDLDYIKRTYFLISDHRMTWDRASLRVFKDDAIASTIANKTRGLVRLDPTRDSTSTGHAQVHGTFTVLQPGLDYELIFPYQSTSTTTTEIPVLKMRYPLNTTDLLAVTYVENIGGVQTPIGNPDPNVENPSQQKPASNYLLKMIKPTFEMLPEVPGGRYDPAAPWYPALHYELRNFYDLTAKNISKETLTLKVRRLDASQTVDPEAIGDSTLIVITGLDQHGVTVDDPPDGRIDDNFLDAENGIIFFPDFHPFSPGCAPNFLCQDNTSRNILTGPLANDNVYYAKNPDPTNQTRYYIDAQFKSSQSGYFLGRFNILENSEQVKVDNILQKKDSDYIIDYESGQLTFTRPPGPDAVISVDYSFAPGISTVQRTLMGFSTSYSPSADFSLTSSMLYESRGAQELNPKLGEEPARSMVGDLASVMTFRPSWMTGLANLLPGVHTTAPSTLNLQGNVAVSVPNPNTKGVAYIEDMEGNRESNTVSLSRTGWMWSSIPVNADSAQSLYSSIVGDHARLQWFNPTSARGGAKEKDLKPVLTKEEGSDNEHMVLEMKVDSTNSFTGKPWTGITQPLSRTGQDLSRTRFIEVWVNDKNANHTLTNGKLHIDFGRVSEYAFWEQDQLPNHVLDTEDRKGGVPDTKLDDGEDTGLDGLMDKDEPGYNPNTNPDPNGDDYHYDQNNPNDYSKINGLEGNSTGIANSRPDTEDLDLNGRLDELNSYFEATIGLSDTAYVAVDVQRDYPGNPAVRADNGWRLFRIPLDSPAFVPHGGPSWGDIKHARLWLSDMTGPMSIQVGGIELVGSRWLATPLPTAYTDTTRLTSVLFDVKVRNNKDDAATYTAPFDVPNAVGGTATRREQSLAMAYDHLQPGDSVYAFKTYSDNGSGVGYTQYRDILFYAHGDPGVEAQKLRLLARFGADTVNYYEYSLPVKSGWQDVRIPMEVLSLLKETSSDRVKIDSTTAADIGARYTVVGNPSFTRVNRITFGMTVYDPGVGPSGSGRGPGEVWVDELRLDGVRKNVGKTGNFAMQANFADVLSVNGSYAKQDQDFFRVGSGVNQGTGLNHTAVGVSSTLFLDKLLPVSGLQLPVRINVNHSADVPKYRTGSDVVLDKARSDIETRSADRQSIDFDYSRTGPRTGLTKYTIDAVTGSLAYSRSANVDPTAYDSTWSFTSRGTYTLPLGGGPGLPIPVSKGLRLKFLPDVVSFGADWSAIRHSSYGRFIQGTQDSSVLRANNLGRLLTLHTRATYLPLRGITTEYQLNSARDMLQRQTGFVGNVGTEVDHQQLLGLTWAPRRVLFLNPRISLNGSYRENAGAGVRLSASDPLGLKNISNTGQVIATTGIPLSRFAQRFQGSASDSGGGNPLLWPLRFVLGRMQDIQTNFSFKRGSNLSRVTGKPGLAFITGFTQKFDPTLARASSSNLIQTREYVTGASTTIQPLPRLSVDVRADHRLSYDDQLVGPRRTYTLNWPDLNGRWLQLQQTLGLEEMLSSLVVSSHYSERDEEQGPKGKPIDTSTKTTTWGPLLRWEASFRNGIRADVTTAATKTEGLDRQLGGVTRTHLTKNHDIHLTKTYPASKGIRFPWSKRRVKLPNDVNLNLTLGIARDTQQTERAGVAPIIETDSKRLNVASGTTYNFTPSITGGFDLAFRQTKDYKQNLTQRGITISVNGQFRF